MCNATTRGRWLGRLVLGALLVGTWSPAGAWVPPGEPLVLRLQSTKLKASGKLAKCQADAMAKAMLRGFDPQPEPPLPALELCKEKAIVAMSKADAQCVAALGGACPAWTVPMLVDMVGEGVARAAGYVVQEVDASSRYQDLGDGTVLDTQTGLQWEKKNAADGNMHFTNPHDADNVYTWNDAEEWLQGYTFPPIGTAFVEFLAKLNDGWSWDGAATTSCFAGHCDWRLPTVEELAGIQDFDAPGCAAQTDACIDPALRPVNTIPVYWSITQMPLPTLGKAWAVSYIPATISPVSVDKLLDLPVRAVRTHR